jgi:hypothetical protein
LPLLHESTGSSQQQARFSQRHLLPVRERIGIARLSSAQAWVVPTDHQGFASTVDAES